MEDNQSSANQLWDAAEVAAFMKVSRSWIYSRVEAGLLPHVRVGSLIRFEPEVLEDFLRRERLSATGAVARNKAVRSHRAA